MPCAAFPLSKASYNSSRGLALDVEACYNIRYACTFLIRIQPTKPRWSPAQSHVRPEDLCRERGECTITCAKVD